MDQRGPNPSWISMGGLLGGGGAFLGLLVLSYLKGLDLSWAKVIFLGLVLGHELEYFFKSASIMTGWEKASRLAFVFGSLILLVAYGRDAISQ